MQDVWASEIISGFLWLGSARNARNLSQLHKNQITHILSVANDVGNYFPEEFIYHNLHVRDLGKDEGISRTFQSAFKFIEEAENKDGGRVLVHCAGGSNRSATIVVAYMMHCKALSLSEAFDFVLAKRRISPPHDNLLELLKWEAKLYNGKNSMALRDFESKVSKQ